MVTQLITPMPAPSFRHTAPMTPQDHSYDNFGGGREPTIVDPSSYDWASSQPFYPDISSKTPIYPNCHDPSTSYTSSLHAIKLPALEQLLPTPSVVSEPAEAPRPTTAPVIADPPLDEAGQEVRELEPPSLPAIQVDMNMAKQGTWAAFPGFRTPLVVYVAQIASWFWFAPRSRTQPQATTDGSTSPTAAEESLSALSINPLQVQVNVDFSSFVNRILQSTHVSHSVVILSLLYLSRLTDKQGVWGIQGTENGAYVVSLMLANKYLDDNTYTNRTWSDLSSIPLVQINEMEGQFLTGIDYRLSVKRSEFDGFTRALDGFMLSHQRHATRQYAITGVEVPSSLSSTIPSSSVFREQPRARSHSPVDSFAESTVAVPEYISPTTGRKRSAGDAFQVDTTPAEQMAKSMRVPSRRGYVQLQGAQQQQSYTHAPPGLGRALSLSRQAASTSVAGRRGSTPSMATHHAQLAAARMAAVTQTPSGPQQAQQWQSDLQPPAQMPQQNVPQAGHVPPQAPQQLMFYTLAAEAHPGVDGHRRKATLHFQAPPQQYHEPNRYPVPDQYQAGPSIAAHPPALTPAYAPTPAAHQPAYASHATTPVGEHPGYHHLSNAAPLPTPNPFGYPSHQFAFGQPAIPVPGQFANAGPPAFQYQPDGYNPPHTLAIPHNYAFAPSLPVHPAHQLPTPQAIPPQQGVWHQTQNSWDGTHPAQHHPQHSRLMMQSRSEWSSPMPGYGPFRNGY